jgi:hypothetical protein
MTRQTSSITSKNKNEVSSKDSHGQAKHTVVTTSSVKESKEGAKEKAPGKEKESKVN